MNLYEKANVYKKVLKKNNLKLHLVKEIDEVLNRLNSVVSVLDIEIRG